MKVVRSVAEMASVGGGDLGFVPTMGAFHKGHLALMRESKKNHERTCVSLFVNPLQFGPNEDFKRYPRDEERDFRLADEVGVDIIFAPPPNEIYPRESTRIHIPEITSSWEGSIRPGHFDGVATVVAKLFNIVRPRVAYFGWKDLQQCLVIKRMVEDLNMQLALSFVDTMREEDGLAMSSRNVYLSPEDRAVAPLLRATLLKAANSIRNGGDASLVLQEARKELESSRFDVQYLELVSLDDLQPVKQASGAALIVAAKLGTTRLIDNLRLDAP